jgi:phosphoglycerol transferase MdoB-like AlkP superfamily enzyme
LGTIFLASCALAAYVNYQYLGIFKNHIDVFFFEILDPENMSEVLKTIWADFPVIWIGIASLLLVGAIFFLLQHVPVRLSRYWPQPGSTQKISVTIICLVLVALASRGAVTSRPYSISRATLSPDMFLNKIVLNGVMAIYEADREQLRDMSVVPVSSQQLSEAMQYLYPQQSNGGDISLDDFLTRTKLNVDRPKANVVLAMMESFGAHLLSYHSTTNNVLGSLETHASEDYFFTRFSASANTTAQSLEKTLMAHAFRASVSSSVHQKIPMIASAARLFESKGYRTVYVTGGRKTWANMNKFMLSQGFQEVYDEYTILRDVPGAEGGRAWGVYDQYSYDFVTKLLREKDDRPLFIVLLTVTNHSPFEPPPEYEGYPTDLETLLPLTSLTDHKKIAGILKTYQYANNSLGDFITTIKSDSSLSDSTIIAASGDHELRYLFKISEPEVSWKYRVPFYLYLPDIYRQGTHKDVSRFGSHKDIFPTIYERLFKNTEYYATGLDLLSQAYAPARALAWNKDFAMDAYGAISITGERRYFEWQNNAHELLRPVQKPSGDLKRLEIKADAYSRMVRAFTLMQMEAASSDE